MFTHLCLCSQLIKVLGATFDGASTNRRLVKLQETVLYTKFPTSMYQIRGIYILSQTLPISSKPLETAGHQIAVLCIIAHKGNVYLAIYLAII